VTTYTHSEPAPTQDRSRPNGIVSPFAVSANQRGVPLVFQPASTGGTRITWDPAVNRDGLAKNREG